MREQNGYCVDSDVLLNYYVYDPIALSDPRLTSCKVGPFHFFNLSPKA